ncbi:MAG: AbrB/MazE/SpoVT family DNA-binding domain-containing protein [Promethearchaeota archaeon]
MDRNFRKLQVLGGSYYISLPKHWVENFGLEKNSPVAVDVRNDGTLLVSPKLKQEKADLKEELKLLMSPSVVREIIWHSFAGETNLVIVSDKGFEKDIRNQIRRFVNGLPNTEITEEEQNRIVIQNFGYKKIPTKQLIHRLLSLISDMFDDLLDDSIEDLQYNFTQLKKFYFILVIHIRTYLRTNVYVTEDNDFTPLEAMDYRMFCENIQRIGKILKDLRLNENVMEYFKEVRQYFNDTMDAYLKKDLVEAHKNWMRKDKVVENAKPFLDTLDYDDKDKIKLIILIAQNIKKLAALI